jgi:hypothetical protein
MKTLNTGFDSLSEAVTTYVKRASNDEKVALFKAIISDLTCHNRSLEDYAVMDLDNEAFNGALQSYSPSDIVSNLDSDFRWSDDYFYISDNMDICSINNYDYEQKLLDNETEIIDNWASVDFEHVITGIPELDRAMDAVNNAEEFNITLKDGTEMEVVGYYYDYDKEELIYTAFREPSAGYEEVAASALQ